MTALSGTPTTRLGLKTFAAGDVPDLYSSTGGLTEVLTQIDTAVWARPTSSPPTTAKTASATLTAAESVGYRVTMTSASATTITINNGVFTTGDTVFITNLGAGICTITAGSASVNSAGSLALSQYGSGWLVMTAAATGIFYPSAGANSVSTVASASAIAITGDGLFPLTGTTSVNTMTGGTTGCTVTLLASGQATGICVVLNHATSTNNLSLRDSLNFGIYAGESVTFVFNGTYWNEVSRNVRRELVYKEKTTDTSITSTGTNGTEVATTDAVTMDGSTIIIAELFASGIARGSNWIEPLFAVDGATVKEAGYQTSSNNGPATSLVRYTPSAGSHTFAYRAKVDAGTGLIIATGLAPTFIRISRAS